MKKCLDDGYVFLVIPLAVLNTPEVLCDGNLGVTWDPTQAIADGTACSSQEGDVAILTMGNDLSIVATNLRLDLPADPDVPLVGLENCGVRIPVTVSAGHYLDQLTQRLTYGIDKTSDTSAKITAGAGFVAGTVVSFTVDLPLGAMTDLDRTDESTLPFLVTDACGGTPYESLFRANVAISGIKGSSGEALRVGAIAPMDFRHDISLSSTYCPP